MQESIEALSRTLFPSSSMKNLRSLRFTLLIALFSCAIPISANAGEPTSVGSVGIRIAQIPAAVAEEPLAGSYIISRLQPGISLTQRLEVFNTSTQEIKVSIYPGLATFKNNKFLIGEGRNGNELTSWTKLSPNILVLKPGATQYFNMTISPPADALSLQQFGVIWAEVQGAPNASGITAVSRVGIRMYVPVGNAPNISIGYQVTSSTINEIIVKKSLVSRYIVEVILFFIFLSLIFLILLLFFLRRGKSDRKFRKENERQLEAQWKRERDRRRKIWKTGSRSHQNPPHQDHYEDENE